MLLLLRLPGERLAVEERELLLCLVVPVSRRVPLDVELLLLCQCSLFVLHEIGSTWLRYS